MIRIRIRIKIRRRRERGRKPPAINEMQPFYKWMDIRRGMG